MYLYTVTDDRTMKKHWHFGGKGCDGCRHRFECFTNDSIHIKPMKIDLEEWHVPYRQGDARFKAEFHLPKCLRLGLFKQISDTGFYFGDGFKLGAIVEEDEQIFIERSWVKFPNILYVTGIGTFNGL